MLCILSSCEQEAMYESAITLIALLHTLYICKLQRLHLKIRVGSCNLLDNNYIFLTLYFTLTGSLLANFNSDQAGCVEQTNMQLDWLVQFGRNDGTDDSIWVSKSKNRIVLLPSAIQSVKIKRNDSFFFFWSFFHHFTFQNYYYICESYVTRYIAIP